MEVVARVGTVETATGFTTTISLPVETGESHHLTLSLKSKLRLTREVCCNADFHLLVLLRLHQSTVHPSVYLPSPSLPSLSHSLQQVQHLTVHPTLILEPPSRTLPFQLLLPLLLVLL